MPEPDIAILLGTRNGERYLESQILSIARQRKVRCRLHVSDDGSTDGTLAVLAAAVNRLSLECAPPRQGPCRGPAANFLSLVTDTTIQAAFYAYCDQDDLWDDDKLARALAALSSLDAASPALYCARTRTVTAAGRVTGCSPLFRRPPGFANALLHNIGGGNTMVFNDAARRLLCRAGVVDVPSHDWWTYQLVSGAGGTVIYDPEPSLSYRQHDENVVGANTGGRRRVRRYRAFLRGRNRGWNARNLAALQQQEALLTEPNRRVLQQFARMRTANLFGRLGALRRSGVYAQTLSGNVGLFFATLFKKI